jgi:ABC-type antimicrobial peptide transport system permease subunit
MQLLTLFGVLGVVIAVVGVYGTVAYLVSQRTKEIGVRIALGATRARVVWMFLRGAVAPSAVGLALGTLGAWWSGALVAPFLFRLGPADIGVFAVALSLLAAAVAAASGIPAARAAMIDPAQTLRCE